MDDHGVPQGHDPRGIGHVAQTLLTYVETGTTFRTAQAATLPAATYTDPGIWRREQQMIFHRLPLLLALSGELPGPGSYKAMQACGKPVLITRDRDGAVHAMLNVCTHRGAPVAADGCGRRARFTCPYHAWTYGADGALLAISGADSFGPLDRAARNLVRLPCAERAGMIFAILTPGLELDPEAFYGAMLEEFAALGLQHYAFLGTREIAGPNWKISFDGNLEGYHFASLHPTTIHPRSFSNLAHYEAFGPHLRIGFAQTAIREKLAAVPRERWAEQENHGFDFVRILFPNVSVFVAPEITQFMQTFPGPTPDANRTVMLYARREPPRDEADRAALDQMMDFLRDVVRDEDYRMGFGIQHGLHSGALENVIFGQNERGNQYFHEWVNYYAGGGHGPRPVL